LVAHDPKDVALGHADPGASELFQQAIDVVEFLAGAFLVGAAAAELFLDRLGALALAFLGDCYVGVVGGVALAVATEWVAAVGVGAFGGTG
jgi:hypothetical protein